MNKWIVLSIFLLLALSSLATQGDDGSTKPTVAPVARRPLIAIWGGTSPLDDEISKLRIALWEDGRVVFATDPKKWGSKLLEGKIPAKRVAEVKKRIAETGVFSLKVKSAIVPDAIIDYILVDFGHRQQMLCWDEIEDPYYGMGAHPTAEELKFKACWKAINQLVLAIRPENAQLIEGGDDVIQESWYLKLPKKTHELRPGFRK